MALLRRKKKEEKDDGQGADAGASGAGALAAPTDAAPREAADAPQPAETAPPGPPPEPSPSRPREAQRRVPAGAGAGLPRSLFDLSDRMPSREAMEQEAAAELEAAIAPSWNRLMAEVPDAGSPIEAEQKIQSRLGPIRTDSDAALPSHPIYSGDTLVYYQLRRHYGAPNPGGSFWRSWFPQSP